MLKKRWTRNPVVASVAALATGCAAAPQAARPVMPVFQAPAFGPAPTVNVQTPGVVIDGGSFTLDATAQAAPFDLGSSCVLHPTTQHAGDGELNGGRRVVISLPPELAGLAGGQNQVHGILALCGVPPGATGAAARHYALQIPGSRLEQTSDGRVSLIYEPFVSDESGEGGLAWMLWLSRTPFPAAVATPGVQTVGGAYIAHQQTQWNNENAYQPVPESSSGGTSQGTILAVSLLGGLLVTGLIVGIVFAAVD